MAQRHPTGTAMAADSGEFSNTPATDLSAAIDTLTQATQALTATAAQMMQMMHAVTSGTGLGQAAPGGAPAGQINTWEDDPFSEATPTQNLSLIHI